MVSQEAGNLDGCSISYKQSPGGLVWVGEGSPPAPNETTQYIPGRASRGCSVKHHLPQKSLAEIVDEVNCCCIVVGG